MQAVNATAYLVNTGWNRTGNRISIRDTRAIIDAILSGEMDASETARIPYFNLAIPGTLHHVTSNILDPRSTYQDVGQWDAKAKNLAQIFIGNFNRFTDTESGKSLIAAGPEI